MDVLFRRMHFFYCRRVPRLSIALVVLGITGCLLLLTLFTVERNLKPTIKQIGEAKARQVATEAINNAVKHKIADSVNYQDLVFVQKDSQGRIVLMQPNIVRINQLASDTTLYINDDLKKLENKEFSIPLGQVLGSQLLANYGPGIKVNIRPIGTVKTSVSDTFTEAGINQTRHRLYLNIESQVRVVVP
ncbi:MAG TPA: sporulation protein YunB, partial [Peptococcaceae bacterium]|nr:sporulation protein YunB [Peptococcaceae bacterium]